MGPPETAVETEPLGNSCVPLGSVLSMCMFKQQMSQNRVEVTGLGPSHLPHHPACGCASLSLALRVAYRLTVSLRYMWDPHAPHFIWDHQDRPVGGFQ